MKTRSLTVLGILLFSFLVASLSFAESPGKEGPYVANFNYTPSSHATPGSGSVTFASSGVVYVSDNKTTTGSDWRQSPQFSQLSAAIKDDIPELLVAKGFNVRGPFDSYDLIPYSDKKNVDFYLIPALELFASWKDTDVKEDGGGFSGKAYRGTGTIQITGSLTIKLQEIMTREQLWSKSIPISYSFPYDVRFPYFTKGSLPFDMSLVMNDLARGLEQQYPTAMKTLSDLIDPQEMRVIKRQALELKKKKGY